MTSKETDFPIGYNLIQYTYIADEELRREAPSIIIHDTSEAAQRPSTNEQRPRSGLCE